MAAVEQPEPREQGWYADPSGRHSVRWWDGGAWTAYAGDGVAVQWDPLPSEEPEERAPGMTGIVIAFVAFGIGAFAGFVVGLAIPSSEQSRAAEISLTSLALWLPLVVACVVVSRRRGSGSFINDYWFNFRWSDVGIGLAGSIAGRVLSASFLAPIPFPSRSLNEIDKMVFGESIEGAATWVVLIVVTCIGAPLVEELFFRGLVQARLVGRYGPVVGIVAASVLFGAAHLIAWQGAWTFAYAWAVTAGGLVLGTIFHLSRRLGPAVAAHALFNAQAMLALAFLA